jgi:hypothetical protein
MYALAGEQRFEEAVDVRERATALAHALGRQRRIEGLVGAGRVVVEVGGSAAIELDGGRLTRAWPTDLGEADADRPALAFGSGVEPARSSREPDVLPQMPLPFPPPLAREVADEVTCIAAWLDSQTERYRLVSTERGLSSAIPRVPSFEPRRSPIVRRPDRG